MIMTVGCAFTFGNLAFKCSIKVEVKKCNRISVKCSKRVKNEDKTM